MMLSGFRSRWTTFARWAHAMPAQVSSMIWSFRASGSGSRRRMRSPTESPLDVFHRDERLAVEFAVFEDRDDVGVPQPAQRLRFLNETLPQGRIVEIAPDHLDRHEPVEHRILRQVERAHPTLRELSGHPILADDLRYWQQGSLQRVTTIIRRVSPACRDSHRLCRAGRFQGRSV